MPKTSARLLSLLSLLQSRRDWSGHALAERLEVSARTVRRDVDRLRELGYPIHAVKGPDGGYRLGAGTELPPLLFDDEQAVAVTVALRTAALTGAGIGEAAERALSTVRQVMPARLRHRVDTLRVTAVERPGPRPDPQVDPRLLLTLGAAVRAREVLRFDHASVPRPAADGTSPRQEAPGARDVLGTPGTREAPEPAKAPEEPPVLPATGPRRVEPHHLVTLGGRWYLVAWDLDRDDWRVFRVDRITPRTPNGPRFTPREVPGGDVAAFVTSRFRGSDGTGGWPCRGEVVLDLPAAVVAGHTRDGVVEELGPHRCRLALGAWSWPALAAAIGAFDADIHVIGPPELRAAFGQLARRYAGAAAEEPTSPPRAFDA
ncbi:helix-turn-helix transcriptional regulator [Streptomyces fructofermentans]|nr:WYL domain-containing protein [Streptomyces fructofermentans]